jgi:hypothetical protein
MPEISSITDLDLIDESTSTTDMVSCSPRKLPIELMTSPLIDICDSAYIKLPLSSVLLLIFIGFSIIGSGNAIGLIITINFENLLATNDLNSPVMGAGPGV